MICVNHVTLVGIVTKIWKNEKSWKFNLETTKPSHDGSRTFTTSHTCVVFGNAIRYLPHMEEGMWLHVEGELNTSSYEKDGKTVWSTNVVTRNVQASAGSQDLGNPSQGQHQGAYPPPSNGNGYRPPVPPQSHGGQQQQPQQQQQYQQQPQQQQQQQQQPQQQQYQQQPAFNSEDVPF